MKLRTLSSIAGLALIGVIAAQDPAASFKSIQVQTFSAGATLNSGGGGNLTLNIPSALQAITPAFFGKNVVIPLELQGTSGSIAQFQQDNRASAATVTMQYQLFSTAGTAVGSVLTIPVSFQPTGQATVMAGNAVIPVQNIEVLRNGGTLALFFILQNGSQTIQYKAPSGSPYQIQFVDTWTQNVDASGSIVTVPDPDFVDGKTQLVFAPSALSGAGQVVVHQMDPITVPGGPGGLPPLSLYTFDLTGATLQREVDITMTYPTHTDGSMIGSNGNPANLAPYWLQGANWIVLGPHEWDSTLHTVSATSPHFSTFALFLSGGFSGADLRPKRRILTPNGDGINDTIDFTGIDQGESVHIYSVRGRRIKTLPPTNLKWDGTDDNGRIVESGIYIYQYNSQGSRVSGVILVVK